MNYIIRAPQSQQYFWAQYFLSTVRVRYCVIAICATRRSKRLKMKPAHWHEPPAWQASRRSSEPTGSCVGFYVATHDPESDPTSVLLHCYPIDLAHWNPP